MRKNIATKWILLFACILCFMLAGLFIVNGKANVDKVNADGFSEFDEDISETNWDDYENFIMNDGASIRLQSQTDAFYNGMRFSAKIKKFAFDYLTGASYYMVIMPKSYASLGYALNVESSYVWDNDNVASYPGLFILGHDTPAVAGKARVLYYSCTPVPIDADGNVTNEIEETVSYELRASVIDMKVQNSATKYVAQAFAVKPNGDKVFATPASENGRYRSILDVSIRARDDGRFSDYNEILEKYESDYVEWYEKGHGGVEPTYSYGVDYYLDYEYVKTVNVSGNELNSEVSNTPSPENIGLTADDVYFISERSKLSGKVYADDELKLKASYIGKYYLTIERANGTQQTVNFTVDDRDLVLANLSLTEDDAQYEYSWQTALPKKLALDSTQVFTETRLLKSYNLTINYKYSDLSTVAESYVHTYDYGSEYSVLSPAVTGYTPSIATVSGTLLGAETINVTYSPNTYTVYIDNNGGIAGTSSISATYGDSFTVTNPTRSGYKFAGWTVASGLNPETAKYGTALSQENSVSTAKSYCYIKGNDVDYNGNNYWSGEVSFKNLTAEHNALVKLKAMWTYVGQLRDAENKSSILNNANNDVSSSDTVMLASCLTGDFELRFSYYQNAMIDETNYEYSKASNKTAVLLIGKNGDSDYRSYLRLNGLSYSLTSPAGTFSTDGSYGAYNNYGDLFYGLSGNISGITSEYFAKFVKNSLVTVTVTGSRVGFVNGSLTITQIITSLGKDYYNDNVIITYTLDLADGLYYNSGLEIGILADDSELSIERAEVEFLFDGYTYTAQDNVLYGALVDNYMHYCPDAYFTGNFDFTVSYHASQVGYYSAIGDASWRTPYLIFYQWQNTAERILFREDCWGQLGPNTNLFTFDNTAYAIGDFDTAVTGKYTNNANFSNAVKLQLYRNATVSCRCIRTGNVVEVYMFISYPGRTEITLVNGYRFTTTVQNLAYQVVGRTSGVTISYEEYATNHKTISGDALCGTSTFNTGSYTFGANKTRLHLAFAYPVKAGTVVTYSGNASYNWAVIESPAYYGAIDDVTHSRYSDTGWKASSVTSYTVQRDSYIAFNLRYTDNTTQFPADANSHRTILKTLFTISFDMNNINTRVRPFTTSMLEENSTYGLTTYSGEFGEASTRCHVAVVPLLKAGTVISFTGGNNYRWSVLELMNEREVLYDTTWLDPSTTTSYTITRDCYVAVNMRYNDNSSFESVNYKSLLYSFIHVEGYCGMVISDNDYTQSTTEEGDMQSINHRGYSWEKPENTLSAYSTSKQKGFTKVETDVNFTSDGYGVLIHDGNINRTSNGGDVHVNNITIAVARTYDFGYQDKFGDAFPNELIPKFEEFIILCKNLQLHPYIELKDGTKPQIQRLANLVRRYGMEDNVTWISFSYACLSYVRDVSPEARLGYLASDITESVVNTANQLKTGRNEVFLDIYYGCIDTYEEAETRIPLCRDNNLPLELWTVNSEAVIRNTYANTGGYVTGYTSDNIIAEDLNLGE